MAEKKTKATEEVKDYSSMKRDELLALAREMGAKVNTKTKKADLIAAIEAIEKAAEEPAEPAVTAEPEEAAAKESEAAAAEPEAAPVEMKASTERKRKEKAERREAKAARKEANKIEEKKKRPSNLLIAILIFGVFIGMFAFIGGYNYFSKPASIEAYMEEYGMSDMYTDVQYDENSTITVRADGNTLKMLIKVDEDASEEVLEEYTGEDATEELKEMGAQYLTSLKPEVRGFSGTVKVGVKQGDETINYVKLSYSEAKKLIKELEKKAEEEAEEAENAADDEADEADDAAADAEDTSEATGE